MKSLSESTIPEDEEKKTHDDEGAHLKTPPRDNLTSRFKSPSSPEEESAIQEILDRGSDVEDDEIEEATKRLLACTLLQGEIDDIWNDNAEASAMHDDDQSEDYEAESGHYDAVDNRGNDISNATVGYGSHDFTPSVEIGRSDEPPNEKTSLLGHENTSSDSLRSHNEELLQPSIFTTITDIDIQRRMNFN
jgi:hypothetical protein